MKQNTSWGNVADWYAALLKDPDNYQSQVILPNLVRVMDVKPTHTVLDLACGTGFFSEVFCSQGGKVIGVDISPELIEIAKAHASKDISFSVSQAHKLPMIESGTVDSIAIVLALQNIKEAKETLTECFRVLKPGGKVCIVLNHPAYRIPTASSWEWDEKNNKQFRRIDQYLSEKSVEIAMHPGAKPHEKTVSFHRPLQFYVKAARASGFVITRLEEWISHKASQKGPRQQEEDRIRKEIPLFMLLECTKL
ncbi:MAG: class I SAM-dependent methyltransferase [Patescibacteria group bacterium]